LPYYEESPFGAAIGVAGGMLQGQQQAKQQAMQQEALRQEIAQRVADQRLREEELKHTISHDQIQDNISQGLNPTTGQPFFPSDPKPKKGASDAAWADWARSAAIGAMQSGNYGAAKGYQDLATGYDTGAYREAEAEYTTKGKLPLAIAQTANVEGLFEQQLKLANIRATASEHNAGLRAARAGAKARGNPSDTAYAAALREISSESIRMAVEGAVMQYQQASMDRRATINQQGQFTQPQPTLQMPNITIQGVPGPSGQVIPIILPSGMNVPSSQKSGSSAPPKPKKVPAGTHVKIGGIDFVMGKDGQLHQLGASGSW